MKLSFFGGAGEVGRSAFLVDTGNEKILLDYGLKVDASPPTFPQSVTQKLDAVILSHGHFDHIGGVPVLFAKGQNCPVFGTEITSHFSRVLLNDSLKIASQEGYKLGYNSEHIKKTIKQFRPVEFRRNFNIGKTKVTPYDAGHISGSIMPRLENEKSVLYTGDFKTEDTRLMKGADLNIEGVDALITETTYSDREHPNRIEEERKFVDFVNGTLDNGGVSLVACFAISRTQELLLVLDEYDINYPIYIDGMAWEITKIINSYPELQREYQMVEKVLQRTDAQPVGNPSRRKKIIKEPCIIISGSGMLSGGPMAYYLKKLHDSEESSLSLTGFQVSGTPGSQLLETGRFNNGEIDVKLKMRYRKFDFSSHASRSEIFKLIKKINPEKIFCVHGDKTEVFSEELKREHGLDAFAPLNGRSYEL